MNKIILLLHDDTKLNNNSMHHKVLCMISRLFTNRDFHPEWILFAFFISFYPLNISAEIKEFPKIDCLAGNSSDTIIYFDTIFTYQIIYDTISVFDTVYIEEYDKMPSRKVHKVKNKSTGLKTDNKFLTRDPVLSNGPHNTKLSMDISVSGFLPTYNFQSNKDSNSELLQLRKTSFIPKGGYNTGLNLNYHLSNKFYIQTGFSFAMYNETIDFYSVKTITDTTFSTEYHWTGQNIIDTIYFLNLDSLILGDTVWIAYYDTISTGTMDTIQIENYNSHDITNQHKGNNYWQYFEIPVLGVFNYNFQSFRLSFKTGIIAGLLYKFERTEVYSENSLFISSTQRSRELETLCWSTYLSLAAEYRLSEHWAVTGEPWIRFPLTQFTGSEGISLKYNAQGFKTGIRYYF